MKTNEELRQDVMEEIKCDPVLHDAATDIGVAANDGVVTLSGLVNTLGKKLAAEKAAQRVAGVSVVAEDIEVIPTGIHQRNDTEIALSVKRALSWHSALNEDEIKVKVDNGIIYLEGIVDWDYQKKAAEYGVRDLTGVRGIVNRISIKTKNTEPKEIKGNIASAFHRSATIDSSNIQIEVNGSHVILRGKVRSLAEKQDAENAVWASPGVASLDNRIVVNSEVIA